LRAVRSGQKMINSFWLLRAAKTNFKKRCFLIKKIKFYILSPVAIIYPSPQFRGRFLEIENMDKEKSNLEVIKFKLEFTWLMIVTGRDEEASAVFNEALTLLNAEIENQKEVA
jgi:hypothetical protein